MANTQDIRAKIVSTKKTQQTTRAMKMVSAAKLKKAQDSITNARPYAKKLRSVIQKLSTNQTLEHSLLGKPTEKGKMLLVVLTSDKGLCGGFNSSIIKYAKNFYDMNKDSREIEFFFIGRRGADFFKKLDVTSVDTIFNLVGDIEFNFAAQVADRLIKSFKEGEFTEIRLIYNEFKSAICQEVVDEVLLPVELEGAVEGETIDFLFEPKAEDILEDLLIKHFNVQVYRSFQESVASEHGARMNAMENATKNAGEMIDTLTLTYNKIRQAAITTELIEITSGAEALKN